VGCSLIFVGTKGAARFCKELCLSGISVLIVAIIVVVALFVILLKYSWQPGISAWPSCLGQSMIGEGLLCSCQREGKEFSSPSSLLASSASVWASGNRLQHHMCQYSRALAALSVAFLSVASLKDNQHRPRSQQ